MSWGVWAAIILFALGVVVYQGYREQQDDPTGAIGGAPFSTYEDAVIEIGVPSWDSYDDPDCAQAGPNYRCATVRLLVQNYAYEPLNFTYQVQRDGQDVPILRTEGSDGSTYGDGRQLAARGSFAVWLILAFPFDPEGYDLVISGTYSPPGNEFVLATHGSCGVAWGDRRCGGFPE